MASHQERDRALGRREAERPGRKRVAIGGARRRRSRPAVAGDRHPFHEPTVAVGERDVERDELLLEPPRPDPEPEASAAGAVERRGLLREDDRMPERQHEHRGPDRHARGRAGDQRHRDQGVEVRRVGRPGRAAVIGEGVPGHDLLGQHDVVAHPEGVESGLLERRSHARNPELQRPAAAVRDESAYAHGEPCKQRVRGGQARIRRTVGRRDRAGVDFCRGAALVFGQEPNVRVPNSEAVGTAA